MKTLALTITFIIVSFLGYAQNNEGKTITITIDNVMNDNGVVLIGLHSEDTFMKAKGLINENAIIENGKISVVFKNVQPGDYAIMALHDENENGRMDYETTGMPKEAYGMSNNPMSYGPPQYNDAKFTLSNEDLNLKIRF